MQQPTKDCDFGSSILCSLGFRNLNDVLSKLHLVGLSSNVITWPVGTPARSSAAHPCLIKVEWQYSGKRRRDRNLIVTILRRQWLTMH